MGGFYPALLPLQQCLALRRVHHGASRAAPRVSRAGSSTRCSPCSRSRTQLASEVLHGDARPGARVPAGPGGGLRHPLARTRPAAFLALATRSSSPAAALTKDEGVLLGLLLAVSIIAAGLRHARPPRRRRASSSCSARSRSCPWRLWLESHHQPVSAQGVYSWSELVHPGYLADRLDRLTYAVGHMVDLLVDPTRWSPILPLTLASADRARADAARPLRDGRRLDRRRLPRPRDRLLDRHTRHHWYISTSADRVVGTLPIVAGRRPTAAARDRARARPRGGGRGSIGEAGAKGRAVGGAWSTGQGEPTALSSPWHCWRSTPSAADGEAPGFYASAAPATSGPSRLSHHCAPGPLDSITRTGFTAAVDSSNRAPRRRRGGKPPLRVPSGT